MEVELKPAHRMVKGLKILKEAVACTLGPGGQNVLIELKNGHPMLTKDGVTVAKFVTDDEDALARSAIRAVIVAASQMNAQIGDGTTTAVILTCQLGELLLTKVQQHQRRAVTQHLEKLMQLAIKAVESLQTPTECTKEALEKVAILSCNNRPELAGPVAEAVSLVGMDGVVTFREAMSGDQTSVEVVAGCSFPRGWVSHYLISDKDRGVFDVQNCLVFVTEHTLHEAQQLFELMKYMAGPAKDKGLLIVAPDIVDDALSMLVVNQQKLGMKLCAVRAPNVGHRRRETLEDITLSTGGVLVSEQAYPTLKGTPGSKLAECLGTASSVLVSREHTVIAGGAGDKETLNKRVQTLREELKSLAPGHERTHTEERLARLAGGVGLIRVGGWDDSEISANKFLIDDGIHACFAALRDGTIPAGGLGFKAALRAMDDLPPPSTLEESLAREVFRETLEAPLVRLISNGESSGGGQSTPKVHGILAQLLDSQENVGYNVMTQTFENFEDAGLVEPASLVKTALEISFGCASTFGQTMAAIVSTKEEQDLARQGRR